MVLHLLIDIEIGRRRCIEASQQFIDHDQEFHPSWLIDKAFLHLSLKLPNFIHRRIFRLIEVRREHLSIDIVLAQLLGKPLTRLLAFDVCRSRPIRSHNGAFIRQISLLKHLKEATGRINTTGNEHRIPVTALQPIARFHIEQNICDNHFQTVP